MKTLWILLASALLTPCLADEYKTMEQVHREMADRIDVTRLRHEIERAAQVYEGLDDPEATVLRVTKSPFGLNGQIRSGVVTFILKAENSRMEGSFRIGKDDDKTEILTFVHPISAGDCALFKAAIKGLDIPELEKIKIPLSDWTLDGGSIDAEICDAEGSARIGFKNPDYDRVLELVSFRLLDVVFHGVVFGPFVVDFMDKKPEWFGSDGDDVDPFGGSVEDGAKTTPEGNGP